VATLMWSRGCARLRGCKACAFAGTRKILKLKFDLQQFDYMARNRQRLTLVTGDDEEDLTSNGSSRNNGEEHEVDADASALAPWPNKVNGADLLDESKTVVTEHLILPQYGDAAFSLWAVHSYVYNLFEHTPRLFLKSPTKRCGKTTSQTLRKAA
jgi:hypothetical protein